LKGPLDVYRHLGRPRPAQPQASPPPGAAPEALKLKPGMKIKQLDEGEPEGESRWRSVRPGDVAPASEWYDEVRQLLIELADSLGLPTSSLLVEQLEGCESTNQLVDRRANRVRNALIAFQEETMNGGGEDRTNKANSGLSFNSILYADGTDHSAGVVDDPEQAEADGQGDGGPLGKGSPGALHHQNSPQRLKFDEQTRTVILDGRECSGLEPLAFKAFQRIYEETWAGRRITGDELNLGRADRYLRKYLPEALLALIDSRGGKSLSHKWLYAAFG